MTNRICGAIIPSDSKKEIIKGDFSYETHNKNYLRRFRSADALNLRRLRRKKDTASDTKTNSNYTAEAGKLIMATNATFPPYEYKEGETIVGIDAEVAKLIADKLGLELEIADVEFDSIYPGVQTGKYDMGMAGMTVTDEAQKER